jgi:hypothetical protein
MDRETKQRDIATNKKRKEEHVTEREYVQQECRVKALSQNAIFELGHDHG